VTRALWVVPGPATDHQRRATPAPAASSSNTTHAVTTAQRPTPIRGAQWHQDPQDPPPTTVQVAATPVTVDTRRRAHRTRRTHSHRRRSCRRQYTSKRRFEQATCSTHSSSELLQQKFLRLATNAFNWKEHCFFCGSLCNVDDLDTKKHRVMTIELMLSVLAQCAARVDKWGLEVEARLRTCNCLIAEEAVYHKNCHRDFRSVTSVSRDRPGRPADSIKAENFELLCQ